jgi:DNA-binding IclR family transcriptional regulator
MMAGLLSGCSGGVSKCNWRRNVFLANKSDSSIDRVLAVLNLFTVKKPVWTVEMLTEELGVTRATVYRYMKSLHQVGFLVPTAGGGYALGPRFIENDRLIRMADPLLRIAPPIMEKLPRPFCGAQILASFYGDRAVSIYVDRADPDITIKMELGRSFPLLVGPPSRAILAQLPPHQLRNLLLNHPKEVAEAGLGENWREFRTKLKAIRTAGYDAMVSQDPSVITVAAPIFRAPNAVTASLCLARRQAVAEPNDLEKLAELVISAAAEISAQLQASDANPVGQMPHLVTPRLRTLTKAY